MGPRHILIFFHPPSWNFQAMNDAKKKIYMNRLIQAVRSPPLRRVTAIQTEGINISQMQIVSETITYVVHPTP